MFTVVNLWGLFILLLFLRHQSLLHESSRVKFLGLQVNGQLAVVLFPHQLFLHSVIITLLMAGINILPVRYIYVHNTVSDLIKTMQTVC